MKEDFKLKRNPPCTLSDKAIDVLSRGFYPTGIDPLDYGLGFKFRKKEMIGIGGGTMNMLISKPDCDIQSMLLQMAMNIVRPYGNESKVIYYDIKAKIPSYYEFYKNSAGYSEEEYENKFFKILPNKSCNILKDVVDIIYNARINPDYAFTDKLGYYDESVRFHNMAPTVLILDGIDIIGNEYAASEDQIKSRITILQILRSLLHVGNIILFIPNTIITTENMNRLSVPYLRESERLGGGSTGVFLCDNVIRFDNSSSIAQLKSMPGGKEPIYSFNSTIRVEDGTSLGYEDLADIMRVSILKTRINNCGQLCNIKVDQYGKYISHLYGDDLDSLLKDMTEILK